MSGFQYFPDYYGYPMAMNARRDVGRKTTYRIRMGKQQSYPYVISPDPRTPAQLFRRWLFAQSIYGWHSLNAADKQTWENSVPAGKVMSGFNYYISCYMASYG